MKKSIFRIPLFCAGLLTGLVISGCTGTASPAPQETSAEPVLLRLAVLPVLDTLPMYVAEQEGLFAGKGLKVEFIPVQSAPERDQLIAAGQADGMVNEALSTAFFNKEQVGAQVVRYARTATDQNALFSILASKENDIDTLDELKGTEIGISQGTVIEYLTDRLLQAEGFQPEEIQTIAVPKIDDRMNLLSTGSLKAAMLPEPLTTLAKSGGAKVILDDTSHPEYSFSTITFRKAVIDENPAAMRAFLAAIEEAVALINANPEKYQDLMVQKKVVPPALEGIFKVPQFVTAGVPSQAQWQDMIAWAKEKGLLDQDVSYTDSVNSSFLPK
jgi:NitT/TauT family transport system substrate-binding protein